MVIAPAHRLRILFYVQHLSGVGHYVRSLEIARALAETHEVTLTEGGREVPHTNIPSLQHLSLPRVTRTAQGLAPFDSSRSLNELMATRQDLICDHIARNAPDVVIIEHYPFSKWELGDEIIGLLSAARSAHSGVKVICSVRDIPRQTSHEACDAEAYTLGVLARLHDRFDGLMVHADAKVTSLAEHFPGAGDILLPICHTGIISEPFATRANTQAEIVRLTLDRPYVLVSVGGGADAVQLLEHSINAWRQIKQRGGLPEYQLVLCAGLNQDVAVLQTLVQDEDSVLLLSFTPDFLQWLGAAALSISCAGYNTCANLLRTRCRALLVPNPHMSDQAARAAILGKLGAAHTLITEHLTSEKLAEAITLSLQQAPVRHSVNLDGANTSVRFIEQLASF
jgi:predicted glycosyltransferase